MDDVADASSHTVTLETGSSEPTDRTTSTRAGNAVGYEDQIEVEPLEQNGNEDECKMTRGGELIPRSPIRKPFRLSLAVFSGIMMICGREKLLFVILQVHMNKFLHYCMSVLHIILN